MLSPEVWNFEPPSFLVSTDFCESEEEIFQRIRHQYFNHHVSVTIPNTVQIPDDIVNTVLEDSQYYRINKIRAAELLKNEFLDLFVRKGQLTAISLPDCLQQNSLVITPCGKLILSLSQTSFQELGIQDTFTGHSKSSLRKYFLNLDLTSGSNESKKKCQQVQKKLLAHSNLQFDIVLAWQPEVPNVCPSSIAYYFEKNGYIVKTCDIHYKQRLEYNVATPMCVDESNVTDLIEWLGAFSLECDMSSDNFISTLKCPEKSEMLGQVMQLNFTGLFTHSRLQKIISEISHYTKVKSSDMWISLTVQNFQNNILNVKNKQLFCSDGDYLSTIIFQWKRPFLIYVFQDKKS